MGTLKSFRYPDLEPNDAFNLVKQIVDKFGHNQAPLDAIAAAVRMSPKSSGFRIKLADLVQYGLLEGRGKLKATDLAQRLVVGNGEERKAAYKGMMENIQLFNTLYSNLAGQQAPEDITPNLMRITQCERIEADKKKERIRNIYNSFIQKISSGGIMSGPTTSIIGQQRGTVTTVGTGTATGDPDFKTGEVKIFMPKTDKAWKSLLLLLPNIKHEISEEQLDEKEKKKIEEVDSEDQE
jgi:hypothetical protein